MSGEEEPLPRLEVWEQTRGVWRWRYVEGLEEDEHLELASNTPDGSYDDAAAAARLAYPGVPLRRLATEEAQATTTTATTKPPPSRRLLWAGLTGTVSLALAVAALRSGRRWMVLAAPVVAAGVVAQLRRRLP